MEITIIEEKDNKIFKRNEVKFFVEYEGEATPKILDIKSKLVALLDTKKDLIVVDNVQTTIQTGNHFLHIILETFQRFQLSGMNHDTVTDHAHLVRTLDLTFTYHTSGNRTHFRDLEDLEHFHVRSDLFLDFR